MTSESWRKGSIVPCELLMKVRQWMK